MSKIQGKSVTSFMNGPLGTCNIFVGRCGLAGVNFMHVSYL